MCIWFVYKFMIYVSPSSFLLVKYETVCDAFLSPSRQIWNSLWCFPLSFKTNMKQFASLCWIMKWTVWLKGRKLNSISHVTLIFRTHFVFINKSRGTMKKMIFNSISKHTCWFTSLQTCQIHFTTVPERQTWHLVKMEIPCSYK